MGLTGTQQFLRLAKVSAFTKQGKGKDFTGLRCKFNIDKTSESTPNAAKIDIFNLSLDSRTFLEGKEMRLVVEAGYSSGTEIIASGDITKASSKLNHPDWITSIELGDGQVAMQEKHVDLSWSPGTPFQAIFSQAISALGVTAGPSLFGLSHIATGGFSFSGTAKGLLDKLSKRFGLEWSVQDGAVQVSEKGKPVPGSAVLISSTTGLLGNVVKTVTNGIDKKIDGIEFSALLNGQIKPGRLISVNSGTITGFYKVRKVTFDGDTHDGPWFSIVEAEPLK